MKTDTMIHRLPGGVSIVTPASLNLITTYVLREQGDWFEDEIKFLRSVIQSGQVAIDIGANYGVYSLTLASLVKSDGHVWAFEPASETAGFLRQSVEENGFSNVRILQQAVSNAKGIANLKLNDQSELNTLVFETDGSSREESVQVVCLDDCIEEMAWAKVDFLKIDAEGQESKVIEGGNRFFEHFSPLIQYEVKSQADVDMSLVRCLSDIGYDSYRLVPGLNLLVPFSGTDQPDAYLLNLFACKPEKALRLERLGLLVSSEQLAAERKLNRGELDSSKYDWQVFLRDKPYVQQLKLYWLNSPAKEKPDAEKIVQALRLYAMSSDNTLQTVQRVLALESAFLLLDEVCMVDSSSFRLATLARVARDFGYRSYAVSALTTLAKRINETGIVDINEPFMAPLCHYDDQSLNGKPAEWALSSVLEGIELTAAYSSFFTGEAGLGRIEYLVHLGFCSDEMRRRQVLIRERFGVLQKQ